MDFVADLGDASEVLEVPVDGIGRVEVHRGRIRITLTRMIERNGVTREVPCLTLVWSRDAYMAAVEAADQIREAARAEEDKRSEQRRVLRAHH